VWPFVLSEERSSLETYQQGKPIQVARLRQILGLNRIDSRILRRHKAHDVGFGLARVTSIPPSRFSTDRQRSTGRNDCANLTNPAAALVVKARSGLASPLDKPPMPKKPGTNPKGEFAFFNVVYEDGSVRSNRRVPNEILGGL
jgi:hypothetical protein